MSQKNSSSLSPSPPASDSEDDGPTTSLKFTEIRCKVTHLGEVKQAPIDIVDQPAVNERTYHIHTTENQRGVHFVNKSNLKSMSSALPLEIFMPKAHFDSLVRFIQKASVGRVLSDGVNYYSLISEKKDAKNISHSLVENTFRKLVHTT
ncbi:unnamed protein product [Bemisia tabaci]|uniref:Uncharacterized protein n=1 Tax=Bemisia tabaci TaxID=7038 RepID=A0A9P0A1G5_BEMTA|nr:unnamed protein product [Bemisia tabaci]